MPGSGAVQVKSSFAILLCTLEARPNGILGLWYDVVAAVQSAPVVWWKNVDAAYVRWNTGSLSERLSA